MESRFVCCLVSKAAEEHDRNGPHVKFRICHLGIKGCITLQLITEFGVITFLDVYSALPDQDKTDQIIFERNYGWCSYNGLKRVRTPQVGFFFFFGMVQEG